jgi:hypothetical protein
VLIYAGDKGGAFLHLVYRQANLSSYLIVHLGFEYVIAKGLPIAEEKSEYLIHPLITEC